MNTGDPSILPAEPQDADAASVPLMITRAQRVALRDLGIEDAAIATMTPAEAHRILRLNRRL